MNYDPLTFAETETNDDGCLYFAIPLILILIIGLTLSAVLKGC